MTIGFAAQSLHDSFSELCKAIFYNLRTPMQTVVLWWHRYSIIVFLLNDSYGSRLSLELLFQTALFHYFFHVVPHKLRHWLNQRSGPYLVSCKDVLKQSYLDNFSTLQTRTMSKRRCSTTLISPFSIRCKIAAFIPFFPQGISDLYHMHDSIFDGI